MKKLVTVLKLSIIILLVSSTVQPPISALEARDRELIQKGILYYDYVERTCTTGSSYPGEVLDVSASDGSIYQSNVQGPYTLEEWAIHTLKAIAGKVGKDEANFVTKEHVIALVAFALGEGGDINNTSSVFNPLNTGLNAPELLNGANAVDGTQSFKSFDAGVEATARTMVGSNQNRLAQTLSKRDSTAKDFMTALTYYNRYNGNKFWAAASLPPNQNSYYQERLALIRTVRNDYANIASFVIGTPALEQQAGIRAKEKLQFDGSSNVANVSDAPEVSQNCACSTNQDSDNSALTGENSRLQAFNFFVSRGATPIQAAGIVGNFMQESGENLDPNASNGTHEGIAQWDRPNRWANLLEFAEQDQYKDKGPRSLIVQLEFALQEAPMETYLETRPTTTARAAELFDEIFERSGGSALDKRRANAQRVFEEAGSPSASTSESDANDPICPEGAGGGPSQSVNADGYALPVKKEGVNLPCRSSTCHHDGTPAADLGITEAWEGTPVYAIVDGKVENLKYRAGFGGSAAPRECMAFQLVGNDGWHYWYGHIKDVSVRNGQSVKAGQQIAVIGQSSCADDTPPHLHIDRGSPKGNGGGRECCRDPGFIPLLNKIYEDTR